MYLVLRLSYHRKFFSVVMKQILFVFAVFFLPILLLSKTNEKYFADSGSFAFREFAGLKATEFEKPLNISIEFDIWSFIKTKNDEDYHDAILKIYRENNETIEKKIKLKARGNFRKINCFFPPIQLNFKDDSIPDYGLSGKVKLVTHCTGSKKSEKFVAREYLAYKMFNVLSDTSFRVRFLNIKYIDTSPKKKNYQGVGFIIEPIEKLSERTGTRLLNEKLVLKNNLFSEEADIISLFQYMIGNTDWKFSGGHNIKYLNPGSGSNLKVLPVPYDFDFSGFVGTSYATPQEFTSLTNVFDREYLGYCRQDDELYLQTIRLFQTKKNEILEVIQTCDFISKKEMNYLISYLTEFFDSIKEPEVFIRTLKSQCRIDF